MIKLALKVIGLTVILQASSMAFADEMILSMLILLTIALTAAALVTRRAEETPLAEAMEPLIAGVDRELVAATNGD